MIDQQAPVARCSGCGAYTTDRRAITGCHGYCFDPSGKSCNALPCPGCQRVHYWCGSFVDPAPDAVIYDPPAARVSP